MKTSQNGIELIKKFEGCRLETYICPAGVFTIGYGHTGADVKSSMKITQEEAETLLKNDLKAFERGVQRIIKKELTQNQFDALVSFAYNLGLENLKKSTLAKLINQGKIKEASSQFERWVYANGVKLNGLIRRRKAEKDLFIA